MRYKYEGLWVFLELVAAGLVSTGIWVFGAAWLRNLGVL